MAAFASIGAGSGSCAQAMGMTASARALKSKGDKWVFIVLERMPSRRIVK